MRSEIRLLPTTSSAIQRTAIVEKQQRLLARIMKFHDSCEHFIHGVEVEDIFSPQDNPEFCANENGGLDEQGFWQSSAVEDEQLEDEDSDIFPESQGLWMSSSIGIKTAPAAGWEDLIKEELQLRIGQANDSLQRLRMHLGEKSVLYRIHVWSSTSVQTNTRARNDIQRIGFKVNRDVHSYQRAQNAMVNLGASDSILEKYQVLSGEDLVLLRDVTEENRVGQGSEVLPWFWRVGGWNTDPRSEWDDKCELSAFVKA